MTYNEKIAYCDKIHDMMEKGENFVEAFDKIVEKNSLTYREEWELLRFWNLHEN